MFTKILVAMDGSDASRQALVRAVDEAGIWHAGIQVIYVVETNQFVSLSMENPLDFENTFEMIYHVLEKEGEAVLEQAKEYCAGKSITAGTFLKQGHPGSEIVALSEQEKCDLVIVGSHGKSNIDRLLIGSVSSFVVTHSKVTTMVVRG
jgi:nucleotide-binding universal stress UspA family protein